MKKIVCMVIVFFSLITTAYVYTSVNNNNAQAADFSYTDYVKTVQENQKLKKQITKLYKENKSLKMKITSVRMNYIEQLQQKDQEIANIIAMYEAEKENWLAGIPNN